MQKRTIKNELIEAGVDMENVIVLRGGKDAEVEVKLVFDEEGHGDYDATEALKDHVLAALVAASGHTWGGYRTGRGSWILSRDYQLEGKDYCDKSSRIHY